ncbi:MAG TPA: hypothetical protein VFJ18_13625 [Pararhizobium sp.]|nr:hypothetical protein [Pararhizobium sp.]
MLIALLATLMFFAMLVATFTAMRSEMSEQPIRVKVRNRPIDPKQHHRRPW